MYGKYPPSHFTSHQRPMIDYDEFEDDDTPTREKIHRNREPVNGRHDMQRRAENGKNRAIKTQRRQKERERES